MKLQGSRALVTGAASGIGRALAMGLARRECRLALCDIDMAGLDDVGNRVREAGAADVSLHHLDVADGAAIAALPEAILERHGGLDLLINNAGVAVGGTFEQIAEADFDWLFSINFFGIVRMTRAFLPMLQGSGDARIVNLSSVFGLIAPPGQTAYAASKFAVRGFSESLRHELAGNGIGVTTVHPGGVATAIAMQARLPRGLASADADLHRHAFSALLTMPPETAAAAILRAIERRRPRIVIGRDAKFAAALERLMPVSYWTLLERLKR